MEKKIHEKVLSSKEDLLTVITEIWHHLDKEYRFELMKSKPGRTKVDRKSSRNGN